MTDKKIENRHMVGGDYFRFWYNKKSKTNLSLLSVGDSVNIEFDILAKYTEQLLNKREIKDV